MYGSSVEIWYVYDLVGEGFYGVEPFTSMLVTKRLS
jgi:Leu/Phe-tRNA-protein transferase